MVDHDRRIPLELPPLRQWLFHLIDSYDALAEAGEIGYRDEEIRLYRASLVSAAMACYGEFRRPVRARIRELLALGVASYGLTGGLPAEGPFSGPMVVDFMVCSLWPLATAPTLPPHWLDAFIAITGSPPLATPVIQARYRRRTHEAMSPREFGQALAEVNFAGGVGNLLRDLSDPARGGCALAAMAIASARYAPRRGATDKRVARWALRAALGGAGEALTTVNDGLAHYPRHPPLPPGQAAAVGEPAALPGPGAPRHRGEPAAVGGSAVLAAQGEPGPATLTAGPAARPVIFGRR